MKYFSYLIKIVFVSVLLILPGLVRAACIAPLADHVPEDALVYIGWAGTNNLQSQYQNSNLKKIVESSQIDIVFKKLLPELMAKVSKNNNRYKAVVKSLKPLLESLSDKPTALYFSASTSASGMPSLAVLTRAGDSAESLKTKWKNVLKATGRLPFPVYLNTIENNTVVFAAGYIAPAQKKTLGIKSASKVAEAKPISKNKLFVEDIKHTVSHPALLVHINMNRMFDLIEKWHHKIHNIPMGAVHTPSMPPDPKVVVGDLGLDGLNSFTFGAGFGNDGWDTELFVNAPAPRSGLLSAIGAIGNQTLDHVPYSAQYVQSFSFDLAKVISTIDKTVKDTNPQEYPSFASALSEIDKVLGASLVNQILPTLGNKWTLYLDKKIGGTGLPGIVIIAHPKDAAKASQVLTDMGASIARKIEQHIYKKINIQPYTFSFEKQTVHVVPTPVVSPSWIVSNGVIYIGMYPQTALSAALYKGKTIADNPSFNRLRKKLVNNKSVRAFEKPVTRASSPCLKVHGQDAHVTKKSFSEPLIVSIRYYNLPDILSQSYSSMLIMQGYANFLRLFNIDIPVMIIPPLHDIAGVISPAASTVTVDNRGLRFKIHEPFAGSLLIALAGNYSAQQVITTLTVWMSFY